MSGAAAAPDGPSSLSRLFSGTFLKTLETYEHVKSKLRNHGFVELCYHQRLDDGRIIVLSYKHIMLC